MNLAKMHKTSPVHPHNCEKCIYLGTLTPIPRDEDYIDCYFCRKSVVGSTLIGRFGDSDGEYLSFPTPEHLGGDAFLAVADRWYLYSLLQATRKGLFIDLESKNG